jgi:hypothetical protein
MRPLLPILLLAACAAPSRQAVQLAGDWRRSPPPDAAIAGHAIDCAVADRACVTLLTFRGAACARLGRDDCALDSLRRAAALMPADATPDERAEVALRLADAHERRRDRATGAARGAENAAILAALAPLRDGPAAGLAGHYEAGVALNRAQSGDTPPAARCAALLAARDAASRAADVPGLPPLADRIPQRRAAIAAGLALTPECR